LFVKIGCLVAELYIFPACITHSLIKCSRIGIPPAKVRKIFMGLHFTAGWRSLLNKGAMLKVRLSLFTSVSAYLGMEVKRHENRRLGFKSLKEVKIKKMLYVTSNNYCTIIT